MCFVREILYVHKVLITNGTRIHLFWFLGAPSMEAEMKEIPSLILERKIEVDA